MYGKDVRLLQRQWLATVDSYKVKYWSGKRLANLVICHVFAAHQNAVHDILSYILCNRFVLPHPILCHIAMIFRY